MFPRLLQNPNLIRWVVVSALITCPLHAQQDANPAKGPASGAITLADQPFRMDSVGLSVRFPIGCEVTTNRIGGRATAQIQPKGDTTWILNIQTPVTGKDSATIKDALDETIALIQGSYGIVDPDQKEVLETQAQILDRTENLTLPGGPAARFYVSIPRGNKSRLVKGYTIFKPQSKQYVVFEFICHQQDFARHRGTYEAIVGTAIFENAESVMLARGSAVKAGAALFAQLSDEDYTASFPATEQWSRWYKPSSTGVQMDATELGYRGVRFWKGQRGEINVSKPRTSWAQIDKQEGYLAQVRARVLLDRGVVDTIAMYFQSIDRTEECWTITTSVKDGFGNETSYASETGARTKEDMTVVSTASKSPAVTVKPPIVNEGYISQFETILLPRLLVRKKIQTDMGFYCYQRNQGESGGTIAFRRDLLTQEGGLWVVTTRFREDADPQVSTYADNGDFIRTTMADGSVWEPIELTSLKRLWQNKGHPTDK